MQNAIFLLVGIGEGETCPARYRRGKHALGAGWVRLKVSNKCPFWLKVGLVGTVEAETCPVG